MLIVAGILFSQNVPSGLELIGKMKAAVRAASPLEGTASSSEKGVDPAHFKMMWPGCLSFTVGNPKDRVVEYHWYKGIAYFCMYSPHLKTCVKSNMENPFMPAELMLIGLESSFSHLDIYSEPTNVRLATFETKPVLAVDVITPEQSTGAHNTLYLDRATYLPLGYDQTYLGSKDRTVYKVKYRAKLKKSDFDWHPPKGAKVSANMIDPKHMAKDWIPPEMGRFKG